MADKNKKKEKNKDLKKDIVKEIEKDNKKTIYQRRNFFTGLFSIVLLVIVIVLCFTVTYEEAERYTVKDTKVWLAYENSIESIVYNMDLITDSDDSTYWAYLKDFDIEDDTYEETLQLFSDDIRECYKEFTLSAEEYVNGNPILKYRDVDTISNSDLKKLRDEFTNSTCLSRFDKYNKMEISEDEDVKVRFMKRIEILQELYINEMFVKNNPSFDELLGRKCLEASYIEGASAWLRSEYYRLR